jgi:hypothetical protein
MAVTVRPEPQSSEELTLSSRREDENQLEERAHSFRRLVGFDAAATYNSLPPPDHDVAVMLWFHRTSHFEEAGGIKRIRRAISGAVER